MPSKICELARCLLAQLGTAAIVREPVRSELEGGKGKEIPDTATTTLAVTLYTCNGLCVARVTPVLRTLV